MTFIKLTFSVTCRYHYPDTQLSKALHKGKNSQTSSGSWEWAFSRPWTWRRGPWSRLTYPTIWLFCWANPENFSLFNAADQKLFHFYCQTDAHFASLYARVRFFSIWKFIPFTTGQEQGTGLVKVGKAAASNTNRVI